MRKKIDPFLIMIIIVELLTSAFMVVGMVFDGENIYDVLGILPVIFIVALIGVFWFMVYLPEDIFTKIFFYSFGIFYLLYGFQFNGVLDIQGVPVPGKSDGTIALGVILACGIPAGVLTGISYGVYRVYEVISDIIYKRRREKEKKEEENKAIIREGQRKQANIKKYQDKLLSFSKGETTDVFFLVSNDIETAKYFNKNKQDFDEKVMAYESVLNGGRIKNINISGAIIDNICEVIEKEILLHDYSEIKEMPSKKFCEIYINRWDSHSEVYTIGYLLQLLAETEDQNHKFNFVLVQPDQIYTDIEYYHSGVSTNPWITEDYFTWRDKYPNHLVLLVNKGPLLYEDGVAHEKGAVVVNALLYDKRSGMFEGYYCIDELSRPAFQDGRRSHAVIDVIYPVDEYGHIIDHHVKNIPIAKAAGPLFEIQPTLEKYEISYIVVEDNKIIRRKDYGNNYIDFPYSLYPGYKFSEEDFEEAYRLIGEGPERYYDEGKWKNQDEVARKKKSYWKEKYPQTVLIEVRSNNVGAIVHTMDKESEYVLSALSEGGVISYENDSVFRDAEKLEAAKVDYVIIHSGKIEFENQFDCGAENYEKYVSAGRSGKHIPSISLKLDKSIDHWKAASNYDEKIKVLDEQISHALEIDKDHIVAHAMSEYRKQDAPDLAIELFKRYEQFSSDHMLVSVAAAYNDMGDYEKALHYIDKAPDGEYKEKTKAKILRNTQNL